jgi:hypothetical protein
MRDTIVLAHMGEEALPLLLPLILAVVFLYISARHARRDDGDDRDGEDRRDPPRM